MQAIHLLLLIASIVFFSVHPATTTCNRNPGLGRVRRLEALKQEILMRLGLDEEPSNPSASDVNITDPQFQELLKRVQQVQDLTVRKPCANLDFRTKEVLLFHPTEPVKKTRPLANTALGDECTSNTSVHFYNTYKFKFHIDLQEKNYITNAQLRLKKSLLHSTVQPIDRRVVQKDRIDIYLITRPENYYGEELRRFVKFALLDPDSINGLAVFDVTDEIKLWWQEDAKHAITRAGEIEFELGIRCPQPLTEGIEFIPNFQFFTGSSQDQEGQLVITTYDDNNGEISGGGEEDSEGARKKREEPSEEPEKDLIFCAPEQSACCLNEMRINFLRDFNWTWVVRPLEITVNYCSGSCAVRWGLVNQHAQLLDIYRSRAQHNPTAAPEPCCVPNSYASVALGTHFPPAEPSVQVLDDIVATSCACR